MQPIRPHAALRAAYMIQSDSFPHIAIARYTMPHPQCHIHNATSTMPAAKFPQGARLQLLPATAPARTSHPGPLLYAQVLATDGDLDVVNVAKRNIKHNTSECRHSVRAAQLLWGSDHWLAQLQLPGPVAVVLMSDVVYGSDPGLWEKLVHTLKALAGPGTLLLQAETFRLEGRYAADSMCSSTW
jgi:hypothetical protein